ncbi:GTPase-associated system all-helical protein GASH [Rhizobium sp. SL42]|uniref:GTPase-associated system all-helical protein GASH n=1 Tax=Rhizobium sp. SL42 TaxID=2806346 RepID=UPI001F21264A|nr:GTPase-associated system all-helical protein GASH [Rhizobium sp. SL42]UJW77682.1 hypothetical protein IM739_22440 [Rhizobium sp. SL42]
MAESILIRFLNSGLINVGGDDSKLEKLSLAAKDLSESLKKVPSKALRYSLIAFDPEAPEDDPVVEEALSALQNRWAAYRNTFSSTPIVVVRAMLLEALLIASADDERVGICFVNSARNVLPMMRADNEQTIWSGAVQQVETQVDARAEAEWATPATIAVPALRFDIPELGAAQLTPSTVSKQWLQKELLAAVAPQYHDPEQGNVATGGNPHWPQNHPQQWAGEFGRRSAVTIATAIDSAVSKIQIDHPNLAEPFQTLSSSVSRYVDGTLNAVAAATAGLQRRTQLLWWREALFSPSARTSYRNLPLTVAAAQMAFDLFNDVPLFSPASVSAFLEEAVRRLPEANDSKLRLVSDLVTEAQDAETLAPLRAIASSLTGEPEGRGPLLALIGHPTHAGARNKEVFQLLTGVPIDSMLGPVEWSAWLFRELQAARAATDGATTKRRAAKKA